MRRYLYSFLSGSFITASVFFSLVQLQEKHGPESEAIETLDYLIDEWSEPHVAVDTVAILAQISESIRSQFSVGVIPDTIVALARRVEELYRVPKGVTIAQWILESRFGLSDLKASNYFGHTYAALKPFVDSLQWVTRRETLAMNGAIVAGQAVRFVSYQTLEQCFDAHGKYLAGSARYRPAFATNSPEDFARALAKAGYATDPDYGLKLITIMRRYHL